jgi:hypothetical protein
MLKQQLPNSWLSETSDFEHGGHTATVSRFSDRQLSEACLNSSKIGITVEAQARDAAIAASIIPQSGLGRASSARPHAGRRWAPGVADQRPARPTL